MCSEKCCFESPISVRLEIPGTNIQIAYMSLDGKPFAAMIIDKRSDEHLHFPAADIDTLVQKGLK
jgi:hypothetical protein